ncbi:hypothetical protein QFC24_003736 [Naganishia onofrii]|uniref:Uncharacterized protein n=1 Tax=Naganishia onofrii TaxID=1851511 RepID=A0ACC2XKE9_9TREE|nr:hypothetical protein QFC24_003736 [Naganishia onofrii]
MSAASRQPPQPSLEDITSDWAEWQGQVSSLLEGLQSASQQSAGLDLSETERAEQEVELERSE